MMRSIQTRVSAPVGEVEPVLRAALTANGFGVLTEIDMAATLKSKLGVERAPLKILGACNPQLANNALNLDSEVAFLLPCNVVLEASGHDTVVKVADPRDLLTRPELSELAESAFERLRNVVDSVS